MLQTHPHVRYIRICERTDAQGRRNDVLVVDTNLRLHFEDRKKIDFRLLDLAACIRDFQRDFRGMLGPFKYIDVMAKTNYCLIDPLVPSITQPPSL